jgi:hypothetical protein
MKENTCNYSDNWQPYIGDYDKYEYDIKCHDGTIYENCYPNAGKFSPIDNQKLSINESQVSEIRFSNNPKMMLNEKVSQFKTKFDEIYPSETKPPRFFEFLNHYGGLENIVYHDSLLHERLPQYKREFPKIGRNSVCACGSGKKYKHCCLN